ncbi:MAG: IS30 family transposase [Candidatus Endonucleobacter bathymodioli]|uniref:IS30 family transposase n=1 Tax=Candidatus Endonucleibacter bathymodioli TaxID=539814 RepID=A0AA90NT75_9GAMM|nr:IS30 family transposase [Candidatus Endonucleobacter bathymodioli]
MRHIEKVEPECTLTVRPKTNVRPLMNKRYTHLTQEERYQIWSEKKAGVSNEIIAQDLRRDLSTVKRELARNTGARGYRPKQAHNFAQERHQQKPKATKMVAELKDKITDRLSKQWSPEQIQGRLKRDNQPSVCPATIYQFIREDKAEGGCLYQHLRHKKYKQRTGKPDARGQIRNRVSIDDRPGIVDQKIRLGDWEADTVIGKRHKGVLVTLTERVSKLNLVKRVPSKHADVVTKAIITMLKPYQSDLLTITFDNGKEFAFHEKIKKKLNVDTYFAHPYSSWERGLNENHNGLIRQYLPKSQSLDNVTDKEILDIQNRLNQRPRKLLDFKTPDEIYSEMALAA